MVRGASCGSAVHGVDPSETCKRAPCRRLGRADAAMQPSHARSAVRRAGRACRDRGRRRGCPRAKRAQRSAARRRAHPAARDTAAARSCLGSCYGLAPRRSSWRSPPYAHANCCASGRCGSSSFSTTSRAVANRFRAFGRFHASSRDPRRAFSTSISSSAARMAGQARVPGLSRCRRVALRLVGSDARPSGYGRRFPTTHARHVHGAAAASLVARIERLAGADAARLQIRAPEAPAFRAEPAEIGHRVAPAGDFPIEDRRHALIVHA